jgi:ABC-2 type transport system permease protein
MSSDISTPATAAVAAPAARAHGGTVETLVTLVRRELWEHRALWLAPLATAAVLVVFALFAHGHVRHVVVDGEAYEGFTGQQALALSTLIQAVVWIALNLVMAFVVSFYFVDCLYAERKDRSIYFWKSMPVSDGLTVASKLLVGMVVVPLAVWLLAAACHILISVVFAGHAVLGQLPHGVLAWDTLTWLRVEFLLLLGLLLGVLWNAPLAAYLMLVSVLARRNPLMWALVPVLVAILEAVVFHSSFLWQFIIYRMGGIWDVLARHGNIAFIGHDDPGGGHSHFNMQPLDVLLHQLNFGGAFTNLDLWLGVAVAAGLVYAATRFRRFRDDA